MTRYQPWYSLTSTKGSQKEALNETSVIKSSVQLENPSVILPREKNPSYTHTSSAWRQSLQYEILIQAVRDRDALNTCRNTALLPPLISCSWIIHFHLHPSISLSFFPSLCGKPRAHEVASHEPLIWIWPLLFTSKPSFHGPSTAFECVWWNETKSPIHATSDRTPVNTRKRFLSAHIHMHHHKLTCITEQTALMMQVCFWWYETRPRFV